jgi:hypothetical protein
MNEKLEVIFRYGNREKLGICGNTVLMGLNRLAKAGVTMNVTPGMKVSYGLVVDRWVTQFGTLFLMSHPLWNEESTLRDTLLITEPSLIKVRPLDDTTFYAEGEQQNTGAGRVDATSEEWLTELGYEYHHAAAHGILGGFNSDNALT